MKRLFSKKTKTQHSVKPLTTPQRSEAAESVADFLQIVEVSDAAPFIAALFRRRFGSEPPDFPRHFIALYRNGDGQWQSVGYVHFTRHKHDYLCGG